MAPVTFNARPMNDFSLFDSQVDIIIPFHGQYDMVTNLINSIFRFTRTNYYKIILVDDSSPNSNFLLDITRNSKKHAEKLHKENVVITIRTESQKGYAGACKVGYDSSESPYVCFMNSDCLIDDPLWMRNLGECLLNMKSQGVRMVAPLTNNSVGGDPAQEGLKTDRSNEHIIIDDKSFLTLPCFMCHRQLFPKIGGFLKEYPYGYFEDEEIAARLRKHGFKQAVCKNSFVNHLGQATIKNLWRDKPESMNVMLNENRDRCIADMKVIGKS